MLKKWEAMLGGWVALVFRFGRKCKGGVLLECSLNAGVNYNK